MLAETARQGSIMTETARQGSIMTSLQFVSIFNNERTLYSLVVDVQETQTL
jgi:hypothetical protein